jgi:putative peptidoglycan lipid II flippase
MKSVHTVIRNFMPVLVSRGVVQVSAYVDTMIASFLPTGCLAALVYAQTLYMLPVSLFGMSVSAAELPALSGALGQSGEAAGYLRSRLNAGLRQIALFIVPSAMGFLTLGDVIAGAIYQTGRFTHRDSVYVWAILAGSAIGLLATTLGRLYASAYYALQDTRTPLRFAVARVVVTGLLGYLSALPLPPLLGLDQRWGVVGLTASAGLAGWLEFALLRRSLNARIGATGLSAPFLGRLWAAAAAAAAAGWCVKPAMNPAHPVFLAMGCLCAYGIVYFAMVTVLGVPEMGGLIRKVAGFVRGSGGTKGRPG